MNYHHLTPPPADPNKLCVTVAGELYPVCWFNNLLHRIELEHRNIDAMVSVILDIPVIIRISNHGFRITACHSDPKRYAAILAASTPAKQSDASGTTH